MTSMTLTTMPLIYVAGPFRAENAYEIEKNIRDAEDIGLAICEYGGVAVIPHTMYRFFQGALPDEFWLNATLDILRRCDAIAMLPNWKASQGARGEHALAKKLGLPIFETPNEFGALKHWIDQWKNLPGVV